MFGNALPEKGGDIGRLRDILELWQAGEIELRLGIAFGGRGGRHLGVGKRRFAIPRFPPPLSFRPSRQEALFSVAPVRTPHSRPFLSSRPPPPPHQVSPPPPSPL